MPRSNDCIDEDEWSWQENAYPITPEPLAKQTIKDMGQKHSDL